MTSITRTTPVANLDPTLLASPSAEPRLQLVADVTPNLPAVQARAENVPGASPTPPAATSHWYSPFSQVGGWSRKSWGISRDLWGIGGFGYGSASVATSILGGAVALGADAVGLVTAAPWWVPQPPPDPKGDLLGAIKERALHPPEGFDDFRTAMRQLPNPRYNDTLSYPEMVDKIGADQQMVTEITAALKAQGVGLPQFVVKSLLARPELFMRIFAWAPSDMRRGFDMLNRGYQQGQVGGTTRDHQLAQSVDLNTFDLATIKVNRVNPVRVAGPLHYGELPATGSLDQERHNRLWSEVLDRLAQNQHVSDPAQRFSVRFGDRTFTSLPDFVTALQASGHTFEVRMRMQGADLPDLSVKNADGSFTKLAVPTFTTVGLRGGDGRQALIPNVHFQLDISVTPPAQGIGPRISGAASWYQGINNIGFFPGSVERDSNWTNGKDFVTVRGATAVQTILDAGLYADTIATTASAQHLRADGYGIFGHCGDSAIVGLYSALQQAGRSNDVSVDPEFARRVLGNPSRTFAFPYMINPSAFRGELERRIADTTRSQAERDTYQRLLGTVSQLSDDAAANALPNRDAARRALDVLELVWPAGEEPFEAVPHSKQALRDYLARQ